MDLKTLITPRDPEFLPTVRSAWSSSDFLQRTFPDPKSVELFKWIATNGVLDAPELFARFYPRVPPENLRRTSCGGPTEHTHLVSSINDLERLVQLWELYAAKPFTAIDGVLDFGVGCGRVLKWFAKNLEPSRCHGVDVRQACIAWLQEHYPGTYSRCSTNPPLPFPDDSFDLVYALSVFSHLNLDSNRKWLAELVRVCRPDGRIILSTHGAFTLFVIMNSEEHQAHMRVPRERAAQLLRELPRSNFAYHRIEPENVSVLEGPEDDYGQAFFNETFVLNEWKAGVELLGCVPVTQNWLQDFFVLKPNK